MKRYEVIDHTADIGIKAYGKDLRELFVNAAYWCMKMENKIPAKSKVDIIGDYNPVQIGFGAHKKGLKPADHK